MRSRHVNGWVAWAQFHAALSEGGRATNGIDAYVLGRAGADLYPLQLRTREPAFRLTMWW